MSLHDFFNPRSIAIVGASSDPMAISGRPLRILLQHGYDGALYPVNPRHKELQGLPVYPAIGQVPGPVDLALVAVPARFVPGVLAECAEAGVGHAMVFSSGFAEADADGRVLQDEIKALLARTPMRLCGPNCEGYFNATAGLPAGFSPAIDPDRGYTGHRAGPIGIVAQSGGLGFALMNRGLELGLGFSTVITTGNEVDLSSLDFLDYLVDDPATNVILAFVESLQRPRRLIEIARKAAEARKPLIVAKVGRSEAGRRAAASHTGSLVGSDEAYSAAFRQLGVIRVDDVDEMLDAAVYFSRARLPAGRRVAVLTASGGGGAWLADACAARGLDLPEPEPATQQEIATFIPAYGSARNPVDVTAQGLAHGGLERSLDLLTRSDRFDAVAVVTSLAAENFFRQHEADLRRVVAASPKPILYYSYTTPRPALADIMRDLAIPLYTTPARTAQALANACWYRDFLDREGAGGRVQGAGDEARVQETHSASTPCTLHPASSAGTLHPRDLLAPAAIPAPAEALAHTPDESAALLHQVGAPVALKIDSPDIPHKTDVGGVRLNLATEPEVRDAYASILAAVRAHHPTAAIRGILVQQMVPDGLELILGARRDPDFGPLVLVGLGGIHVEILRDVALRLAPVSPAEARAMLDDLRAAPLLHGARGRPPVDLHALVGAIARFSEVAAQLPPEVAALEINPLIVRPEGQGVMMVDTRIELSPHPRLSQGERGQGPSPPGRGGGEGSGGAPA